MKCSTLASNSNHECTIGILHFNRIPENSEEKISFNRNKNKCHCTEIRFEFAIANVNRNAYERVRTRKSELEENRLSYEASKSIRFLCIKTSV